MAGSLHLALLLTAQVWDRAGKLRVIDGPHSSLLVQQEILPLSLYAASPTQYIRYAMQSLLTHE